MQRTGVNIAVVNHKDFKQPRICPTRRLEFYQIVVQKAY